MSATADASGVFWDDIEVVAEVTTSSPRKPKRTTPTMSVPAWAWVASAIAVNAGVILLVVSAAIVVAAH